MQPLNVIVAQADCVAAEHLAASLHKHFRSVAVARDVDEVRRCISRVAADAIVLDLELSSMEELRQLCAEFARVSVVCTHRVPDETMWMKVMENGAVDCCARNDLGSIVRALSKGDRFADSARAA